MAVQTAIYTNEEFREYAGLPENHRRWLELWNGVLVEMPSPSPLHGLIVSEILYRLKLYLEKNPIGYAIGDTNDFELAPGYVFKPDAAFISKSRLPTLPKRYQLAPDLAVEIVSPSNTSSEVAEKVETYLRFGTKVVWVVYPEEKVVRIYTPAQGNQINLHKLAGDELLDAGELLPSFAVPVHQIFPDIEAEETRE